MAATPEQIKRILGELRIKCVKVGGVTLTGYGAHVFAENDELDLLDVATPDQIRAPRYSTAQVMVTDPACELTQRIDAGEFVILVRRAGDIRVLKEVE